MALRLLCDGDDEPGDRRIGSPEFVRPTQHRSELRDQARLTGGGSLELGVDVIDRVAVDRGVEVCLGVDVVIDRTGRDAHRIGDLAVRGGAKPVASEMLARRSQYVALRLGRAACAGSTHAAATPHAVKVSNIGDAGGTGPFVPAIMVDTPGRKTRFGARMA